MSIRNVGLEIKSNVLLVMLLKKRHMTISFAESCTGGLVAAGIVDVPGASEVFYGSVVTYDNSIKTSLIGVSEDVLNTVGPVSEECAMQMANGVREKIGSDIAISVTGIAGPGGEEPGKPVGTVYLGYSDRNNDKFVLLHLEGNREEIRRKAVEEAYKFAINEISRTEG